MLRPNKAILAVLAAVLLMNPGGLWGQEENQGEPPKEAINLGDNPGDGEEQEQEVWRAASIGLTAGYLYDICTVGSAILSGGVAPLNGDSLASKAGFEYLLMPDKDLMALNEASGNTGASRWKVVDGYQAGGVMEGVDIGTYAMYDFNDWLGVPLFIRGGFSYVTKLTGGVQEVTLGAGVDEIAGDGGSSWPQPVSYKGAQMKAEWGAQWMEVPVSVGMTWECLDRGKVYAGIGGSWFHGGFSVSVDMDKEYAAFLTAYEGEPAKQIVEPVKETIQFTSYGLSANMFLGMEAFVSQNWALTAEYWSGGFANTVYAETEFSDTAGEVMTMALGGPDVTGQDKKYISRFAYPVVLSTVTIKFGVKYYYNSSINSLLSSIFSKD